METIRQKTFKRVLLSTLAYFLAIVFFAQSYAIKRLNIENGLPQSTIYDIEQDDNGFLWFGTQGGVAKYDGIDFKTYSQKDGLPDNHVKVIEQDLKGNIWLGHRYEGVSCLTDERIITYKSEKKSTLVEFKKYKNGIVAIEGNNILTFLELKDDSIYTTKGPSLKKHNITNIYSLNQHQNGLLLTTNNGILFIDENLKIQKKGDLNISIYAIAQKPDKSWIITSENKIQILSEDFKPLNQFTTKQNYLSIEVDQDDNTWLSGEESGVKCLDKNNVAVDLNSIKEVQALKLNKLTKDRQGNIWLSEAENGAIQIITVKFKAINKSNGLNAYIVRSMCLDQLNRLWVAGNKSLELVSLADTINFKPKNIKTITNILDTDFKRIYYLYQDSRKWMWVATENGIYVFNQELKRIKKLSKEDGLSHSSTKSLVEDDNGNIWAVSLAYGASLIKINNRSFSCQSFDKNKGLCSNKFWTILKDRKGLIYFGSNDNGISVYNGQTFNHINKNHGLSNLRAGSLTEDIFGNIWIGSIGGGIYKYNGDSCIQYNSNNGLSSDNPYLVMADGYGSLWIGTNTGVDVLNIKDVQEKKDEKNLFIHYGITRGFTGIETNQNAKHKDKNGNLWFGTIKGVMHCNSLKIKSDSIPPLLNIIDKKLFLRESIKRSQLNYNENHISFEFIGIQFSGSENIKYKYILEGFDEKWSPWTNRRHATYTYLPPGDFTFKLKATNADGFESEIVEYTFTIGAPFWRTPWFYALCIIATLISVFFIITIRTRNIEKANKKLEKKVIKRTKELKDKTKQVELQNLKLKQLALFPEHNPNPVIELDFDFNLIYVNPGAQKHFNNTPLLDKSDPGRKKYEQLLRLTIANKETGVYTISEGFHINNLHYGLNVYIDTEFKLLRLYLSDITDMKHMQGELKEQRDAIIESLNYAQNIQNSILPKLRILDGFFEDYFVLYRPKDIVSGDFYWATSLGDDLLFAMCDCTGHGVPGAFMSIIGSNALNRITKEKNNINLAEIISELNDYYYESRLESNNSVMDSMDIILLHYNKQSQKLHFSGCLQQFYLVRNNELSVYKTQTKPLGLDASKDQFTSEEVQLENGDSFYLFTDGYADQFGGPSSKKFKYPSFRKLLLENSQLKMVDQKIKLISTLESWRNNYSVRHDQIDDISVIGLKL